MDRNIKVPHRVHGRGGEGRRGEEREGGLISGSLRYLVNGLGLPSLITAENYVKKLKS